MPCFDPSGVSWRCCLDLVWHGDWEVWCASVCDILGAFWVVWKRGWD